MKVYVAARFRGTNNKQEIEALCAAVKAADMTDFCFIRDVEQYKHTFDDPKELWQRAYDEIGACDALLIDVSDYPTGGRVVEAGIAYALRKPVIVVKKHGIHHKNLFDGISATVIEYADHKDMSAQLKKFERDRNFSVTDKSTMFVMFLLLGGAISWILAQFFIPLAVVGAVLYWLIVRAVFPPLRSFDRVIIFVPLLCMWAAGLLILQPVNSAFAVAWGIGFWVIALLIIQKAKLSL